MAILFAAAGGIGWNASKEEKPSVTRDRKDIEDDEQSFKGVTYVSLAVLAASVLALIGLSGWSASERKEAAALRMRTETLRRLWRENDCVDYDSR